MKLRLIALTPVVLATLSLGATFGCGTNESSDCGAVGTYSHDDAVAGCTCDDGYTWADPSSW